MVLTTFLNELNSRPEGAILILEDYQVITSPQVHETMAYLLDHLPATLHLVIMSRSDPPLPLARLRVGGDLLELRAADLRFSQEGARLPATGHPVPPPGGNDQTNRRPPGWLGRRAVPAGPHATGSHFLPGDRTPPRYLRGQPSVASGLLRGRGAA